jgi:hypothetical protein
VRGADNTSVMASPDSKIRADRLRSEIAQLEARYDGLFSPGVYSILENLRRELAALDQCRISGCQPAHRAPVLMPGNRP